MTDFTPTSFAIDDQQEFCELCGTPETEEGQLASCEGVTVCEDCAREHGSELAQFADAMSEELRRL